jgi:hypothetical protein
MFKKTGRLKEKAYPRHAKAEFALRYDMITKDEYQGLLSGQMTLEERVLMNLNVSLPHLRTGEKTAIYQGRASDILINLLLDLPPPK